MQLLELCRAATATGDAAPVLDVLRHPRMLQLLLEGERSVWAQPRMPRVCRLSFNTYHHGPRERPSLAHKLDDHAPLHSLLPGLFSPQQASPTVQTVVCQLLGLAAAGPTRFPDSAGAAGHLTPGEAQGHLEAARAVGLRAAAGDKPGSDDLDAVAQATGALPLAGAGLLHLIAAALGSEAAYEDARCAAAVPALLALLRRVLEVHPGRAPAAAAALGGGLAAMGARRPELAEALGSALVALLTAGHAVEVLSAAEAWAAGGADPSLVRAFTLRVLERVGPPYAQAFARPLVRLLAAGKMDTAKRGSMLLPGGPLERVREFAAECLDARDWAPPLSGAEVDMLQRLEA